MTRPTRPTIRAITIDLDETLWPVGPAIARAEAALQSWLETHAPAVAREFSPATMRAMRDELFATLEPGAHVDYGHVRRTVLARAMTMVGEDPAKAHAAYEAFDRGRQDVEFFPDALPALTRLAARFPVAALSNGTADVARVGIGAHFAFALSPRSAGLSKPDPRIFRLACERLQCAPEEVLHVGDDVALDVEAALAAGLRAAWVNRTGADWISARTPDLIVTDLHALLDWLEA